MYQVYNRMLDLAARPRIPVFGRRRSAYLVFGCVGFLFALVLALGLAACRGLSQPVMLGIMFVAVVTFFSLAMVTKVITGKDNLIYYHHEIAILMTTALFLHLLDRPILVYLDITLPGVGLFLAFGRVGCLMVGCCHGRPHRWGIRYGPEHVKEGFMPYLEGVRLFPIQALSAGCAFAIVTVGTVFVLKETPPGTALSWYVFAYGVVRFGLEFLRGDPERPYRLGFSEAQWTSLFLMGAASWLESTGVLPQSAWHFAAAAVLVLTMVVIALRRHFSPASGYRFTHPLFIKELARALKIVASLSASESELITVAALPEIRLSTQILGQDGKHARLYTLSAQKGELTEESARILARLILCIAHPSGSCELINGRGTGFFHVLIHPAENQDR